MKKIKIFLISFLGIILLSSCSSASKIDECFMYTQLNAKDINNWKNINDGKDFIGIIWYNFDNPNCSMDVEIPEKINDIPVKAILREAFLNPYWKTHLNDEKMVNIREQLKNKCDFFSSSKECKKLFNDLKLHSWLKLIQTVSIPESIEEIENRVFENNLIKEIKLWKNIKKIGRWAFQNNDLHFIFIHPNVEKLEIKDTAFLYNNLDNIELPYGTEYDKENSFDTFTEINYK